MHWSVRNKLKTTYSRLQIMRTVTWQ